MASFNTVSTDIGAGSSAVDTAADSAAGAGGQVNTQTDPAPERITNNYVWGGIPL